jgi:hypothetical protein
MCTHATWRGTNIIATAHGFIQWFLNTTVVVILNTTMDCTG